MRKTASIIIVLVVLLLLLAGCSSRLNGTYYSTNGYVTETVSFSSPNKITMSAFGVNLSGTYTINGSNIQITYEILGGLSTTMNQTFSQKGNSVFIGGQEFTKQSTPKN